MIEKLQFRFLDPVLARKYDSDGMATALFTTVGHESFSAPDGAIDSANQAWPPTIIVPRDVIDRLRKVLLTIMSFECMDAYERKEILPNIVTTASFFCEAVPGKNGSNDHSNSRNESNDGSDETNTVDHAMGWFGTVQNTIELRTCEDVRKVLMTLSPGADLKIWIETSPPGILREAGSGARRVFPPSSVPTVPNKECDPNNKGGKCQSSSSSSPARSVSSSLRAIAKAGNHERRRSPRFDIVSTTTLTKQEQSFSTNHTEKKEEIPMATVSQMDKEVDSTRTAARVLDFGCDIPVDAIPIPGFPVFSDFCHAPSNTHYSNTSGRGRITPPMDDTMTTSSMDTRSSISSRSATPDGIPQDDFGRNTNNNDDDDSKNHLLLALAGCAPRGGNSDVDDLYSSDHEDDGLLSGLLISDDEYSSDDDTHAFFSNHQRQNSTCSMLTYSTFQSTISNNVVGIDVGNTSCNDSGTIKGSTISTGGATKTFLMPSFFETEASLSSAPSPVSESLFAKHISGSGLSRFASDASTMGYGSSSLGSHGSVASSLLSSSMVPSVPMTSSGQGALAHPGKDAISLDSSSLFQGPELEMATLLESVLGSIFVPDEDDEVTVGGVEVRDSALPNKYTESQFYRREALRIPCPTPEELLRVLDWDH